MTSAHVFGRPMQMRFRVLARPTRLWMVGATVLVALIGCTASNAEPQGTSSGTPSASEASSAGDPLGAFYGQKVRWKGCGGDFDCTKLKVPADYDNPGAGTLELDVVRVRAKDPKGSLILNPGGPGGSGVEYARAARAVLTPQLADAYDVVGFDPRGVVNSTPVDCIDDSKLDALFAADGTPDTPAEVADLAATSKLFGVGCKSKSPQVAPYMDTESAARDMDILRAVLGDEKLNYLGKSYGTYLGAQYAELFPDNVGRMVIDGVLPSSLDSDQITLGQARAFDMVLRRFVEDCITKEDCPLPRDADAGVARIQQFLADLDQNPIPGTGDRMLTEALGTYAILSYLYFPPNDWDILRFGLDAAFQGDGSVLMDMMDDRIQRNPDGTFANNGNEAFYAVSCLDRPAVGGVDHAAALAEKWAAEAPVFGPYMAWGNLPCWQWPMGAGTAEAAGAPPVFRAQGSAPILVVSTKYDPATPYEWGVQVADELDNATLLTYDGDGHTAYTSGSSCIDRAVDAFFMDGTIPAEGTVCKPDAGSGGTGA
jgi:pimeloyl-ACP methyl ester carboxylesterase